MTSRVVTTLACFVLGRSSVRSDLETLVVGAWRRATFGVD